MAADAAPDSHTRRGSRRSRAAVGVALRTVPARRCRVRARHEGQARSAPCTQPRTCRPRYADARAPRPSRLRRGRLTDTFFRFLDLTSAEVQGAVDGRGDLPHDEEPAAHAADLPQDRRHDPRTCVLQLPRARIAQGIAGSARGCWTRVGAGVNPRLFAGEVAVLHRAGRDEVQMAPRGAICLLWRLMTAAA